MSENTNKKTTCNKKSTTAVLPAPTAQVVAEIIGVSPSYVKKIRSGDREAHSEKAELVKYCEELLIDGQQVLIQTVFEIIKNKHNS